MECKKCKKELVIPSNAYRNLESYKVGGSVLVASSCCNAGYILQMNVSYSAAEYNGEKEEDDWGVTLFKPTLKTEK
jgi:RNase P subunit RPR2